MTCSLCRSSEDIPEKGDFYIRTEHPVLQDHLKMYITSQNMFVSEEQGLLSGSYESLNLLCELIKGIKDSFNKQACDSFQCLLTERGVTDRLFIKRWVSLNALYEILLHPSLYDVIQNELFTTYSQPIIELENSEVYGYEFLLRPIENGPDFKPYELFQMAERAGLQALLDGKARVASIRSSASAVPTGKKRFINFLPSSIYDPKHCLATTFKVVEETGVDPNDLVFEVVETEEIQDMNHLKNILTAYQQQGMKVALDDLGAGHSTLEVLEELKPDYVKIDRKIISFCDEDAEKESLIKQIVQKASIAGSIVLAEGIERKEEAEVALRCGVRLGQGYFYGKPVPTNSLSVTVN